LVPARGESKHADLVRIDVIFRGVQAEQPHGPLRIVRAPAVLSDSSDYGIAHSIAARRAARGIFKSTHAISLDVSQSQTSLGE